MMTTWDDLFRPGDATNFFDPLPDRPFNPQSASYDPLNAWWLAELSRLVYRENEDRKDFLARVALEQVGDFINAFHDTQAFVVIHQSKTWAALVFRGTSTLEDFLIDGDFRLIAFDRGRVHHGFKTAIDDAWPQVQDRLGKLSDSCRLFITGHSLGAALATLAAPRLPRAAALYTFGSPLVGDGDFTASVDAARTFRIVDHNDLVTHVPPSLPPIFPYKHVGQETRLADEKDERAHAVLLPHLSKNGIREMRRLLPGPPDPLADHAPINYVDRIGKLIGFPPRRRG